MGRIPNQSKASLWALSRFMLLTLFTLLLVASAGYSTHPSPRLGAHTIRPNDQLLKMVRAAEFDTLVQVFAWREIEPTQDQFHWQATDQLVAAADYYGLDLVVRLDQHPAWASPVDLSLNGPPEDLADYRDFVERVAERYRGRVRAYIIWNEPNLAIEWGGRPPDPAAFTRLLRTGYRAVKAGDPEALVVAAGLAPTNNNDAAAMDDRLFLSAMYRAGAAPYFDVLGAHAYSFGQAPGQPEIDGEHPAFGRLADLRAIMVEHEDGHKPVWITEMGWTVDPPPEQPDIGVTLTQQADYLAEALALIRRDWPWLELVTVWNLSQPAPGDPFGGYSLLERDGRPRPAYAAWQQAAGSRAGRGLPPVEVAQPNPVPILAADAVIHLGDSDLQPPWQPLFAGRKPSLTWTGGFYLADPGTSDWELVLELMQQNEIGATVEINGVHLTPPLAQQDFTRRWLTVRRAVPAELLRPGYNEVTFTTVRLLPDAQQADFVWDDYQFRNVRLVSPDGDEVRNLGEFSIGGYGVVPYNMDWSPNGALLLTYSHQILTTDGTLIADNMPTAYLIDPTAWLPRAWTRAFIGQHFDENVWSWLDEKKTALESLVAIKRAGADMILTYWAKDAVRWLAE